MYPRSAFGVPRQVPPSPSFRNQPNNANQIRSAGYQQYGTNQTYIGGETKNLQLGTNQQTMRNTTQKQHGSSLSYVVEDNSNPLYGESRASINQLRAANGNSLGDSRSAVMGMFQSYGNSSSPRKSQSYGNSSSGMIQPLMKIQSFDNSSSPRRAQLYDNASTGTIQPLMTIQPYDNASKITQPFGQAGPITNQPTVTYGDEHASVSRFCDNRALPRPSLQNISTEESGERLVPQYEDSRVVRNDPSLAGSFKAEEQQLPQRVYERKCRVEMVQEFLQCGILVLEGGDNRKEYCFFFMKDFIARNPLSENIKMTLALPKGKEVLANAKLADEGSRVPYLATSVWEDGMDLDPNLMSKVFAPINSVDLEKFRQLSVDLAWCLPKIIEDSAEGSILSTRSTVKSVSPTNVPLQGLSPERFPGHLSRISTRREHSPLHRIGSPVHMQLLSRSPAVGGSRRSRSPIHRFSRSPARGRKRSPSPRHAPRDEAKRTRRTSPSPLPSLSSRALMGKVLSYDGTTNTGVIKQDDEHIGSKNKAIFFHVNQVWVAYPKIGSIKFLEVFPTTDFPSLFPVGCRVECTARNATSYLGYELQASSVWKAGEKTPRFETPDLIEDLDMKLADLKYKTGSTKNRENPLKGTPDNNAVRARVHEYFSLEMGFLKLEDGDGSVVLFHLNQVWSSVQNLGLIPLKDYQKGTLEHLHLKIGTVVMVHMRKLPAHQNSELCYQAIVMWQPRVESPSSKLPNEYYKMYGQFDKRLELLQDLDSHYDHFKKLSKLGFPSPDGFSFITPVPAVLNFLPPYWRAIVVATVSDDFGIIRISHNVAVSLTEQFDVKMLHAMFHIEDVYDENGTPSIESSVTMANLLNQEVDLTARSIANNHDSPDLLLKLQSDLKASRNPLHVGTPLLQAIVVSLKPKNGQPSNTLTIPQPTCLRSEPGTFHPRKATAFYLNLTLRLRLNIKLRNFLKLPDKLGLPYESIVYPFLKKESFDEGSKLLELKKVDTNKSSRFLYGDFNTKSVNNEIKEGVLTNFPCTVKYLHQSQLQSTCGILEVTSGPGSFMACKRSSYIFFELSDFKFFTNTNYLASDLVNVIPMDSPDRYHVTAFLCNSNPLVPYIATSVWNEDLRIDMGQPIPIGSTFAELEARLNEKNRMIEDIISMCSEKDTNLEIEESPYGTSANKPCYYGAKCSKHNCRFDHPAPARCRFGSKCFKSGCKFLHPKLGVLDITTGEGKMCRNGSKCHHSSCAYLHPEKDDAPSHIKETGQTSNRDSLSNKNRNPIYIEVPSSVGTVDTPKFHSLVKKKWNGKICVNKNSVLTQGKMIVEYIDNCVGVVEDILSNHYGIITYSNENNDVVRILFSINDVILKRDSSTFKSVIEVLRHRALVKKPSSTLYTILKKGDQVRFSAVMMVTGIPNDAEINYYCVGVTLGIGPKSFVPIMPIKSCRSALPVWKLQYEDLVSSIRSDLTINKLKKSKLAHPVDMHFKKDYELRPLKYRNAKGYLGPHGGAGHNDPLHTLSDIEKEERMNIFTESEMLNKKESEDKVITIDDSEDTKGNEEVRSVLRFQTGKVVKIVNGQYGLAAMVYRKKNATIKDVFQVLFDITDVWLGDETLDTLGKTLENVMKVGDYVMLHGICIEHGECDAKRNIRYMATSLVTADTLESLAKLQFPAQAAPLESIDQVDQKKIDNFKTVVEILGKSKALPNEELILDEIARDDLNEKLHKAQAESYLIQDLEFEQKLTDEEKINGVLYKQFYFCYHCKVFESFIDESKHKIEIASTYTKNHKTHMMSMCKHGCIEAGKLMFKELKIEFEQCLSEKTIYPAMIKKSAMMKHHTRKQVIYECSLCENRQFSNFFSHLKRELHQKQVNLKFGRTMQTLKDNKNLQKPEESDPMFNINSDLGDKDGQWYRHRYYCFHCRKSHAPKSTSYIHSKHMKLCNDEKCVKDGKKDIEEFLQYFTEKIKVGDIIVKKEEMTKAGVQTNYRCNVCNVDFNTMQHFWDHKDFRSKDKENLETRKNALVKEGQGAISNGGYFCFHCKQFEMYVKYRRIDVVHEQHTNKCIEKDCLKLGKEMFDRMEKVFEKCLEDGQIERCSQSKAEGGFYFKCLICQNRITSFMHIHDKHLSIVEQHDVDIKLMEEFENGIKNGDLKLWKETADQDTPGNYYCCLHCVSFFKELTKCPSTHLKNKFHVSHMANCVNREECITEGEKTARVRDLVREPIKEGYIVRVKTEDHSYLWKCLHCEVNFNTKNHLESDMHVKHMKDCGLKCWAEKQRIAEEDSKVKDQETKEIQKQLSCKSAIRLFNSNLYHCFHCKVKNVESSHFSEPFHVNHVKNCGTKMEDCPENPTYNSEIGFLVGKKEIVQFPNKKIAEDEEYDSTVHERFFCFHCQIGFSSRLHIAKSHKQHMKLDICSQKCKMVQYHGSGRDAKSSCMLCNAKRMSREQHDLHLKCSSHKRAVIDKLRKSEREVEEATDVTEFLKVTIPSDEAPLIEIEDSDGEMEDASGAEKLPNVVINQSGYVLIILDDTFAVGRFDYKLYVTENDEWVDKQLNVLFDNKSLLVGEEDEPILSLDGVIKAGDKIRFHGIRIQGEVKSVGDIVQYYSDSVLRGDKCKSKELHFTNTYQKWLRYETRLKDTPIWKHKKDLLEDGFEAIEKSQDEVLNVQMERSFVACKGTVIHTESSLSIIQLDREDKVSVFALYIHSRKVSQSQVGSKSRILQQMAKDAIRLNHSVLLHCVLVDPLGPIQYLATGVWADKEGVEKPEIVPFDDVFEKVLEKFRQLVPRVLYVHQVWQSCPQGLREDVTLEQFTPSQVRKLIMAYIVAIEKRKGNKKASLDMQEIAKEAKLSENITFVQPFLLIVGDKCDQAEEDSAGLVKGIKLKKVFINSTQVGLIKKEGIQTLMTALPKYKEDRIFWRIPSEWKVEKGACRMDLAENWDEKDDCMLVVGFFEHGYNWSKIQKDSQLGLEGKITNENGEVREDVKMKLKQMINTINFRGRISPLALDCSVEGDCEDTESDLENYMDEDELQSLATLKERSFGKDVNLEMEDEVFMDDGGCGRKNKTMRDLIEIKESDTEVVEESELNTTNSSILELTIENSCSIAEDGNGRTSENEPNASIEMEEHNRDLEEEMMAEIDRDIKAIEEEFREKEASK